MKEALSAANEGVASGQAATTQLAGVEASVRRLDGSVASLSQQFDQINRSYDPGSVQKMVEEGKSVAAHEVRSLIYLITGCLACLGRAARAAKPMEPSRTRVFVRLNARNE